MFTIENAYKMWNVNILDIQKKIIKKKETDFTQLQNLNSNNAQKYGDYFILYIQSDNKSNLR